MSPQYDEKRLTFPHAPLNHTVSFSQGLPGSTKRVFTPRYHG